MDGVADKAKIKPGQILRTKWGSTWWAVEVLEAQTDGKIKIHWVGWSKTWDAPKSRSELYMAPKSKKNKKGDAKKRPKSERRKNRKKAEEASKE